jgi:hypothetical protein
LTAHSIFFAAVRDSNSGVAIARAGKPPIDTSADEPTGNLDSRTSVEIMEIYRTNDKGLTIVPDSTNRDRATGETCAGSGMARFERRAGAPSPKAAEVP